MTPTILAFDTSGPYCEATVLHDGQSTTRREDMARGQAERLMGLIEDLLADAHCHWSDLTAIGVGIGPGNFTGIRISVSAARGLALGLGVPAVGVSLLEAHAHGRHPAIACVPAPRGMIYAQAFIDQDPSTPALYAWEEGAFPRSPDGVGTVVGHNAHAIAKAFDLKAAPDDRHVTNQIAQITQIRHLDPQLPPPAPLYIKPADAAPPREAPPVILDA